MLRVHVRAAKPGQTLLVGDAEPMVVPTTWSTLTIPVQGVSEDGELVLEPGSIQTVPGDARKLGVAVQWVEWGPAGWQGYVEQEWALDVGTADTRRALGEGWASDESNGVENWAWTVGDKAMVTIPSSGQAAELILRVRGFRWDGAPPGRLDVAVNGHPARGMDIGKNWSIHRLSLPASEMKAGDNTFELVPTPTASPADVGAGADQRKLGVAVDRLTWVTPRLPARRAADWSMPTGGTLTWEAEPGTYTFQYDRELVGSCDGGDMMPVSVLEVEADCSTVVLVANSDVILSGIERIQ